MTTVRSFAVAGIEVATALLLEIKFGFAVTVLGYLIAIPFLAVMPLKVLHGRFQENLSAISWIRILAAASIAFNALLFYRPYEIISSTNVQLNGGLLLLVADAGMYPCIYMSDALSIGIMQQNLQPEGSWFDAAHATFFQEVGGLTGRCVGPMVARWFVEFTGQDGYAACMLGMLLLFLLIFEVMVRPASSDLI